MKFIAVVLAMGFVLAETAYGATCSRLFNSSIARIESDISLERNPVLSWTYENGKYPNFSRIKPKDLIEALESVVLETRTQIELVKVVERPTFESVIEPLEFNNIKMKKFEGLFGMMYSSFKDSSFKEVEENIIKKLDELEAETSMDAVLFSKIDAVYKNKDKLEPDQQKLVESYRNSFLDNGLSLKGTAKEEFLKNKSELTLLENRFQNNMGKSKAEFALHIQNKAELKGLSENTLKRLQKNAENAKKDGYILTLEPSIYTEAMENLSNRDIRKQLFIANGRVAYETGTTDNSRVVKRIAELRQRQAELLGYKHFSEKSLKLKMAKHLEEVKTFLFRLIDIYRPHALKEEQELQDYVKSKSKDELEPWDRSFWINKLLNEKYAFDENAIKEYLVFDKVQEAAFEIAGKLYGLKFVPRKDLPTADPSMQVFEARGKDDELMAYFIVDPYARMGTKSQGAWASRIYPIYKKGGVRSVPIVTNTTNFTKPEAGHPLLLKVDDAVTVFHEFGHALHSILSQARYPSQSGTAVARDFVELPSQFMENFFFEKSVLKSFAKHYKTGQLISDEMIDSVIKFKQFRAANAALRQFGLSLIDIYWHSGEAPKASETILDFEKRVLAPVSIYADNSGTVMSTKFSHIFDGGYSSGYYSYKWAEVLDADAFSIFKKEGLFNPQTADRFRRTVLESGGSRDAMELYVEFAGRMPDIDAMLERDGFKK